ncbi:deoxyguanosinetriphosphate triphosphohydrolase [Alkalibaculum sp. M08DMB]|uniref:Deoxyguanosinetriphosphate triphosphohydrolase-like protein n=1 Tax=Alkalibaculum sporogenes TaxID=2655001 RepID=A0A6A7KCE7_9FIRM|nr:deoxyguanosinetriphosphate triphosphohydrolase [Alkalibaculum sporogenes]MPW27022.1 deoxyguanosinetriphosphate triphosphohydrolase [Alkalibaculum sporogenes]
MNIREDREQLEKTILSKYATLSINSKGRKSQATQCNIRTIFQRDKDKIIHSKSFRRLKHKTQVFISPEGDHYRTRLTHTLEVSQIARTISRALKLNEDLTEAIALGHDLGHTPFGHTGEKVLNEICSYGFNHNEQSLRVVEHLENGVGLDLSWEVCDGILHHSGKERSQTLEGEIVHLSDRIAYINHDIDDAIRGGVITQKELPKYCMEVLGITRRERIDRMVKSVIYTSYDKEHVKMDDEIQAATTQLRKFLFDQVYIGSKAKEEEVKASFILTSIFQYFRSNPEELSDEYVQRLKEEDKERVICDYIAGMTDRYAINKFRELFIPDPWRVY